MSTSSQWSSSTHTMQACQDPQDVDFDSMFDYEALTSTNSISPVNTRASPPTANPNNTLLPPQSNQEVFPSPSHRYENYRQTTGITSGALETTLSLNPPNNMHLLRSNAGFSMFDTGYGFDEPADEFDFNSLTTIPENESTPPMFFPESTPSSSTPDFIDPVSVVKSEKNAATLSSNGQQQYTRLYPGIHQEQAAKRQQLQQQQRQQQQQQQQQQQSRTGRSSQPTDPIVEEKISQLLKTMRQSSVATAMSDEDGMTPNANGGSSRMRKEEEDMDEDERLLASEEGKKLSSKERRQLRNKVSARAFRSRSKEYIGQLENELAIKTNEANDLKLQNRRLWEENKRMSELTRMLLNSSSFSGFMDNMSAEAGQAEMQSQINSQESPAPTRKDVNPYLARQQLESNQQQGPQVEMALLPDHLMHASNNASWAFQPQVFSVLEVPQGPSIEELDIVSLSGKPSTSSDDMYTTSEKIEPASIDRLSSFEEVKSQEPANVESQEPMGELDASLALFETPTSSPQDKCVSSAPADFTGIPSEKPGHFELVIEGSSQCTEVNASMLHDLERISAKLENSLRRIDRIIPS